GEQLDANGVGHSIRTDRRTFESFDPPGFTATPFPGTSFANGINDAGDIVGGVANGEGGGQQAYVRRGDDFTLYSQPSAGPSGVTDFQGINDAGTCVGAYNDPDGTPRGIIQTADGTTLLEDVLSVPPNRGTFLFDINNVGQMVGGYW